MSLAVLPIRVLVGKAKPTNSNPSKLIRRTHVDNHLELTIKTAVGGIFAISNDIDIKFDIDEAVSVAFVKKGAGHAGRLEHILKNGNRFLDKLCQKKLPAKS